MSSTAQPSSRTVLLKATSITAVSRLVGWPLSIAISAILARLLTREDFATYGALLSAGTLFIVAAQLGYQSSIVRIMAQRDAEADHAGAAREMKTAMIATLVSATALASLLALFGGLVVRDLDGYSAILRASAVAYLVFVATNMVSAEALRGMGKIGAASFLSATGVQGGAVRCIVLIALIAALHVSGPVSLVTVVIASAVSALLCTLAAWWYLRRTISGFATIGASMATFTARLRSNMTFMSADLLNVAASTAMATIIGAALFPVGQIAGLFAAIQIITLIGAPLNLLVAASPALIVRLYNEGKHDELEDVLRYGGSLCFLVGTGICGFLLLLGPPGFELLFGPKYHDAYWHFAFMTPGLIANVFTGVSGRTYLMIGNEKTYNRLMAATLIISLACYIGGATLGGPFGLSAAIGAAMVFNQALVAIRAWSDLDLRLFAYVSPVRYAGIARHLIDVARRKGNMRRSP